MPQDSAFEQIERKSLTSPVLGLVLFYVSLAFYWSSLSFLVLLIGSSNLFLKDKNTFPNSVTTYSQLLAVFAIFYFVSLLTNGLVEIDPFMPWATAALIYIIASNVEVTRTEWLLFSVSLSLYACLVATFLVISYLLNAPSGPVSLLEFTAIPLAVVPNDMTFLALIAPLNCHLIMFSRAHFLRAVGVLAFSGSLVAIVLVESRTALLTFLICTVAFLAYDNRKVFFWFLIGAFIIYLIVDYLLGFPLTSKFTALPTSRIPLWHTSILMFFENPIFGSGPHYFTNYYMENISTFTYPNWITVDDRSISWPHNLFLEVLGGSGSFSLLALTLVLIMTISRLQNTRNTDCFVVSRCLLAIIYGLTFASLFELSLQRTWLILFAAPVLGFANNLSRKHSHS